MKLSLRLIFMMMATAITGVVITILYSDLSRKSESNEKLLAQTSEISAVAMDLLKNTYKAELAIKDFMITEDPAYLGAFKNTNAHGEMLITKLKELTTNTPLQQLRLDTLKTLYNKNSAQTNQHFLLITKNEASKEVQMANSVDSKKIMDQVRIIIGRFIEKEQVLANNFRNELDRLDYTSFLIVVTGMVAGFVMLGASLALLYKENKVRKRDAHELFLKNEWFDKIMISLGDGLIAIDIHGVINMINPSAEIITGWKQAQALGSHIDKIFEITDEVTGLKVINPAIKAIKENKMVPLANHTFLEQKNGNKIYIDDSGSPIHNEKGEVIGAVLIFRDVSDKKKVEDALHDLNLSLKKKVEERTLEIVKSERRLNEAQKISQTGNWEIDLQTNKNSWSDGFYAIFNLEKGAIQPSTKAFLKLLSPGDRAMAKSKFQQGFDTLTESNFIFEFTGKYGTLKHGYLNWQFENDKNSKPVRLYGILQDITERKAAKEKLEHQNMQLKKTNAELDRFVYSSSHDLRAPLTSVMGLINILGDNIGADDIEQQERVEMMKQSITKLDSFIEDIINYSRNSRMEIEKDEIDFEALINESRHSFEYMKVDSGFKINIKVVQTEKFLSDKSRILVNLNNLICNAIKYRDDTKSNPHVNVTVHSDLLKAIITVEDNGIGIAENKKENIFDMFYRGTKRSDGSGLGLYIAKETLAKLDGTITLESKLKYGTTFTIMIPNLIEKTKTYETCAPNRR